ncbi:MAG: hypothetical protein LBE23_05855 [Vagococcus sp.]|jgi:hypothetical protein|nr:hypothetical protein [Vagococcus sp.]
MFITNYSSISSSSVLWVTENTKKYLESLGYCVLSFNGDKWAFEKSDDILNILYSEEGGKNG